MDAERVETVIIGGGQAGLKVGYFLAKQGRPFAILDANERVGDSWRQRWDSLRLFTPTRFNSLPGMKIAARPYSFITKDEMADYLESYAARFGLPVRNRVRVERVTKENGRFTIETATGRIEADNLVVATGAYRSPTVPTIASQLDPGIAQMHSSEYRNPSQLKRGAVLVVGAANSGAEIAWELVKSRRTILAGRDVGQIPVSHGGTAGRLFLPVFRFMMHFVMTLGTPIGRKVIPKLRDKTHPLIRRRRKDLARAGIERVGRVAGVKDGLPVLEDGTVVDVANVIWCTGFREEWSWIDLPVFGPDGRPRQYRGVVEDAQGLYFVGMRFQYAAASDVLPGVGRDAEYVAKQMVSNARTRKSSVAA